MKLTPAEARKLGLPVPKRRSRSPNKASEEFRRQAFLAMCRSHGIPEPIWELYFFPGRKFRFDWAWPENKIALEVQGGNWIGGRHVRPAALEDEHDKRNEAAISNWRILYCTPEEVTTGEVFPVIKRALGLEEKPC